MHSIRCTNLWSKEKIYKIQQECMHTKKYSRKTRQCCPTYIMFKCTTECYNVTRVNEHMTERKM